MTLLRREPFWETICEHELHWTDLEQHLDDKRKNPDICWTCIDEGKYIRL